MIRDGDLDKDVFDAGLCVFGRHVEIPIFRRTHLLSSSSNSRSFFPLRRFSSTSTPPRNRSVSKESTGRPGSTAIELEHRAYGKRWLLCEGEPELLFTENETKRQEALRER